MSNTKFTQGVWDWSHDECTSSMIEIKSDMGCSICRLQSEDNAQLIAEAPELYKMVEQLTGELDLAIKEANLWRNRLINSTTENEPDLLDGQTCHEAQVLLAKARGES
jgi:hypothetical protein